MASRVVAAVDRLQHRLKDWQQTCRLLRHKRCAPFARLRDTPRIASLTPLARQTERNRNFYASSWPAPGSEDTELGVLMGPAVRYGEAEFTREFKLEPVRLIKDRGVS